MKAFLFAGIASSVLLLGSLTTAEASMGCGPFGRRNVYGACRPIGPIAGYRYGYHRPFYAHPYGGHRGYGWHRHYY